MEDKDKTQHTKQGSRTKWWWWLEEKRVLSSACRHRLPTPDPRPDSCTSTGVICHTVNDPIVPLNGQSLNLQMEILACCFSDSASPSGKFNFFDVPSRSVISFHHTWIKPPPSGAGKLFVFVDPIRLFVRICPFPSFSTSISVTRRQSIVRPLWQPKTVLIV
jgi:hypothetical protein